jgi:hypothetical protein
MQKGNRILGINWRIVIGQGGVVTVRIPSMELFEEVKVHGYDDGGLWIESQTLADKVRRGIRQSSLPATPVFSCPTLQFDLGDPRHLGRLFRGSRAV